MGRKSLGLVVLHTLHTVGMMDLNVLTTFVYNYTEKHLDEIRFEIVSLACAGLIGVVDNEAGRYIRISASGCTEIGK